MCVVPSIIVLIITALVVFRRELTAPRAASASKPAPGAARPPGRSSRQSLRPPKPLQAGGLARGETLTKEEANYLIDKGLATGRRP
jgi:hypothetical protein